MTITLDLKPEAEAGLLALAKESGISPEEYVEVIVHGAVLAWTAATMSPEERAAGWRESAKHFPETPLLSDGAVSRDSMYG